jgi:hypothetical protein
MGSTAGMRGQAHDQPGGGDRAHLLVEQRGLTVAALVETHRFLPTRSVSHADMAAVHAVRDPYQPDWNGALHPQ